MVSMGNEKLHFLFSSFQQGLANLSTRILGSNTLIQGALPEILANTPQTFFDGLVQTLHVSVKMYFTYV